MKAFIVAIAALALAGPLRSAPAAQNQDRRPEQTHRETRTFAIGASGTLDLETVSGAIVVRSGPGQSATVEIVMTARGRTEADARAALDRVTVDVEERGQRASVTARDPDKRHSSNNVSVSYTVTAPAGTRI